MVDNTAADSAPVEPATEALQKSHTVGFKSPRTTSSGELDPQLLDKHGLIPAEDFDTKCPPEEVKVSLERFEKKVIGSTLYHIKIDVGDQWQMQATTKKTYEEFKIFH